MTVNLLDVLNELGWETHLVDRRFSASVDEVGRASLTKILRIPLLWLRLIGALVRFRPNVCIFFITNRKGSFLVDVGMAAILRLAPGCRVIHYPHTRGYAELAESGRLWNALVKFLLRTADTIVTLGPSLQDDVRALAGNRAITSIPNFVTPPEVTRNPDAPPTLLFLSNLIPEKGAADFIEIAGIVAKDHPQARFLIAGAPTDPEYVDGLHKRVKDLGIEEQVEFLGQVGDEKWQLLADATALIFPSTYKLEAQPLTIIEAMSVGTPTIGYRIGGVADLVASPSDWLTQPGNYFRLLGLVRRVLGSDTHSSTRQRCLRQYSTGFTRGAFTRSWETVVD